jgi:hypothetical protein
VEVAALQSFLGEELSKLRLDAERERKAQERRLRKLEAERKKLLEAHYADAIPLDLLKSEQDRLTAEIANAEGRLAEIEADFKTVEANLERVLMRAGDCEAAYREATPTMRRQFNLAFFKRLFVGDDDTIAAELAEPFDAILGEELRRAVIAKAGEELTEAVDEALRQRGINGQGESNDTAPTGAGVGSCGRCICLPPFLAWRF